MYFFSLLLGLCLTSTHCLCYTCMEYTVDANLCRFFKIKKIFFNVNLLLSNEIIAAFKIFSSVVLKCSVGVALF